MPIYTDEQKRYLISRAAKWRGLVEEAYNEALRRRAIFVPVNVAGPAKYNFEKANKQAERDLHNSNEWDDKMTAFLSNTAAIPITHHFCFNSISMNVDKFSLKIWYQIKDLV